jgi:DNA-binding IclR family transcriptional regulator
MSQETAGNLKPLRKGLKLLDILFGNFARGFSNSELAQATGLSPSDITRYTAALIDAGYAERVPETDAIRVSHRLAKMALQVMTSLDAASARIEESKQRLTTRT